MLPQLVNSDQTKEAYKSVNYSNMVALLVEAIKEQQGIIKKQNEAIQSLIKEAQIIKTKD